MLPASRRAAGPAHPRWRRETAYLDLLTPEPQPRAAPAADERKAPPGLRQLLTTAITGTSKDDGWSSLSEIGSYLSKRDAASDARDYGHTKLGELVRAQSYVDVKDVPSPGGPSQLWVRLKR